MLGTMAVNNKMAFFSDALGHSALTGIAIGVVLGIGNPIVCMAVSYTHLDVYKRQHLSFVRRHLYNSHNKNKRKVKPFRSNLLNYLSVTLAPTSSSLAFIASASSLATASLITLGAPSTTSLASLRPRPVTSLTTLITSVSYTHLT